MILAAYLIIEFLLCMGASVAFFSSLALCQGLAPTSHFSSLVSVCCGGGESDADTGSNS